MFASVNVATSVKFLAHRFAAVRVKDAVVETLKNRRRRSVKYIDLPIYLGLGCAIGATTKDILNTIDTGEGESPTILDGMIFLYFSMKWEQSRIKRLLIELITIKGTAKKIADGPREKNNRPIQAEMFLLVSTAKVSRLSGSQKNWALAMIDFICGIELIPFA